MYIDVSEFINLIFKSATISDDKSTITFITNDNIAYLMYHDQDCCEVVQVDDICGDLDDLVGSVIISAEEAISTDTMCDGLKQFNDKEINEQLMIDKLKNGSIEEDDGYDSSHTWTFYRIQSSKGSVVIRWYGSSNGYYSESVNIIKKPLN